MPLKQLNQYIKNFLSFFKWTFRLEQLSQKMLYFFIFFILSLILFWFIESIALHYNNTFIEYSFYFILSLPVILITVFFRKDIYSYFLKNLNWGDTAEIFENRQPLSGKLISSADFLEGNYKHNKYLEHKSLEETYNTISKISIIGSVNFKAFKKPLIALLSCFFLLLSTQLIFSYTPFDILKSSLNKSANEIRIIKVEYPKIIKAGQHFYFHLRTNAKQAVFSLNINNKIKSQDLAPIVNKKGYTDFHYNFNKINQSFTFSYTLKRNGKIYQSEEQLVKVIEAPVISSIKTKVKYPAAYGESVKTYNSGNVEGFYGSKVSLNIECNNNISKAELIFYKEDLGNRYRNESLTMSKNNNKASCNFTIYDDMSYQIILTDENGYQNKEQTFYIKTIDDLPPVISILKPEKNQVIQQLINQYIFFEASDDYKLKKIFLNYYKIKTNKAKKSKRYVRFVNVKNKSFINASTILPLSQLNLKPGEKVEYFLTAYDSGNQRHNSRVLSFYYPNAKEVITNYEKQKDDEIENIQKLLGKYNELNNESHNLKRQLENSNLKGQDLKKKLSNLMERDKKLLDEFKNAIKRLEKLEHNLSKQKQSGIEELKEEINKAKSLLKKLLNEKAQQEEIRKQQSFEKILKEQIKKIQELEKIKKEFSNKPFTDEVKEQYKKYVEEKRELKKQLKSTKKDINQLEKLLKSLDMGDKDVQDKFKKIKKLLNDLMKFQTKHNSKEIKDLMKFAQELDQNELNSFNFSQEDYIKRLEKTLEKLNDLKKLQKLIESRQLLKELQKEQNQLNDKLEKNKNDIQPLKKESDSIKQKNNELNNKLNEKKSALDNIKERALQNDIQKALNELNQNIESNSQKDASKKGKELSQLYNELEKEIEKKIKQFQQKDKKEVMDFLRNLLLELIELRKFEGKKSDIIFQGKLNNNFSTPQITKLLDSVIYSNQFLNHHKKRFDKTFEGVMKNTDKAKFLKMFNTISSQLQYSGVNISKKDFHYATYNQNKILDQLNVLTLHLLKLKFKQQSGTGSGAGQNFFEQMQQLMQMQSMINKEIKKLLNKQMNKGLSPGDIEKLKSLSQKQSQLGEQISKLLENGGKNGNNPLPDHLLNSMAEIKRDIDEIKHKLAKKQLDKKLVKQQEDVLKRMSDASKHIKDDETEFKESNNSEKNEEDKQSQAPTMLNEEKKLLKAKKKLRTILKNQKIQNKKYLKNVDPEQKKHIQDYFNKLNQFSR